MKSLLIVANLKSNKTLSEAKDWLDGIRSLRLNTEKKVVACPPFTLLQFFRDYINEKSLPLEVGAQNISRLPQGPYTGEVNGAQIKDFANYVLVGHSERRGSFSEDESVVEEKVKMAIDYNLVPILCVQNADNPIPAQISIVVYEPVFAIGTGNPDTPENANLVAEKIRSKASFDYVLYGGSVTAENVASFTKLDNINGVLVGTDSLDPQKFMEIVDNA